MAAAHSLLPGIEVVAATATQQLVIANLLELYAHDFSEFTDLQLGPDGRFGYPELPTFWTDEGRFPFLVKVDGHLAGFVLVWKGSRVSGDRDVWDVAEFFIARRFRKRGVGTAVAREVWRRFPGRWEVRVMERNQAALAFWNATVDALGGPEARRMTFERNEKRWHVLSFVSSPGDEPMNQPTAEHPPIALHSAVPTLLVDDVGATARWYGEHLGFRLAGNFPEREPYGYASLQRDGAEIMLLRLAGYHKPNLRGLRPEGLWDVYVRMRGVEAFYRTVAGRPYVQQTLVQRPYGDWEFEVVDPNGYILVFGGTAAA